MIEEGETRFRALAAAVDALVFITAPTGQMHWCNQTFKEETGFTTEDFQFPNPDNPFLHPDDAERVAACLADLAGSDDDRTETIENRFFDKWGRVHTFRSFISKVRWEGQQAFLIVSRAIDPESESTRASIDNFRYLVESADDGIVKLSPDGRFHFTNTGFQALVHSDSVAIGKRSFFEFVHAEDRGSAERALTDPDPVTPTAACEVRLVTARGDIRKVSVKTRRLTNGNDAGLILALLRDVTETRRLEDRTRQSQKLESLGLLAGGIAHDFNNLLTGILANASLARELAPPSGRLARVLLELRDAGDRAAALTSSLLTYVGQRPADFRPVDLGQLVADGARSAQTGMSAETRLSIRAEKGIVVRADAGQLTQVVSNLVSNAIEATADGGQVEVEVDEIAIAASDRRNWMTGDALPEGETVCIRVRDDGTGMTPETMRRIFDPFYSTKEMGRGLGLSSVLGIVRAHGGVLALASEPGSGSVFEVILPASTLAPREQTQPEPTADVDSGLILFVDDEQTIRRVARLVLERAGYDIVVVESGELALEEFRKRPEAFRAVVVDHTMPGLDGGQVIERLRALRSDVPVVHTSGYRDLKADVDDVVFLPKPYDADSLVDAIRRAVSDA